MRKFLRVKSICLLVMVCTVIVACAEQPMVFDGEFLERKLTKPYIIEGILTQNGERYEVSVDGTPRSANSPGDFRIQFLSGDVTEGLTVEFFESGVFLFFDDFRFKTNSETFTNLEAVRNSIELLASAHIEKYVKDLAPVEGLDLIEIGVDSENGNVRAHVNQLDGSIVRLSTTLNGADIVLDVRRFENVIRESETEEANEIFEVIDDYIE